MTTPGRESDPERDSELAWAMALQVAQDAAGYANGDVATILAAGLVAFASDAARFGLEWGDALNIGRRELREGLLAHPRAAPAHELRTL